jgi:hypothetical protein
VLIAGLTLLSVRVTRKMLAEMRETRIAQQRPYVMLDFENPRYSLCDMVVKNVGNGPAFDVHVAFDPDPPYRDGQLRLSQLPLFQQMKFFAPGREFRFFYKNMVGPESGPESEDANLVATVTYSDAAGRLYSDDISLNPYLRWHLSQIEEKTLSDVVAGLEDIAKVLAKLEKRLQDFDYRITKDIETSVVMPHEASRDYLRGQLAEVVALWESVYSFDLHRSQTFLQARLRRHGFEVLQSTAYLAARGDIDDPAPLYQIAQKLLDAGTMRFMGDDGEAFHGAGREIVELAKRAVG